MAVEISTAPRGKGEKRVVENLFLITENMTKNYETTIEREENST